MHVIRRHSRQLFFPAGLLALAWLPVLSGALLAARPELRRLRQRVMQVSMHSSKSTSAFFNGRSQQKPLSAHSTRLYTAPACLRTPLHTVCFTGNPWQDNLSMRTATFVARQLVAEPNACRDLRIEFGARSHYQQLVATLDLLRTVELTHYWLDTERLPVSINAFTVYHRSNNTYDLDGCLLCGDFEKYTPPPPSWRQQLQEELATAFHLSTWRPLFSTGWRYSTLLLLLLPLAAARQLRRLHKANPHC